MKIYVNTKRIPMKHSTYNIHVLVSIEDFRPQCTASKTGWIWDAFFKDLSQPYLDTGRGIAISKGQSLQLERTRFSARMCIITGVYVTCA